LKSPTNIGFPIIEIPYSFGWSDIIVAFYDLLYSIRENTNVAIGPGEMEQILDAGRLGTGRLMDKLTGLLKVPMAIVLENRKVWMDNGLPGAKLIGNALDASPLSPDNMAKEVQVAGRWGGCLDCL
jgi:hypothetical protein